MPHLDLTTATMVRVGNDYASEIRIADQLIWKAPNLLPEGGAITTANIGGVNYRIHTFTADGVFEVFAPMMVEYFLVGGGAAGRYNGSAPGPAGGGAAGRVRHNIGSTPLNLAGGLHPVLIGLGGITAANNATFNGGDTQAFGVTAEGGRGSTGMNGGDQGGVGGFAGGTGTASYGGSGASAAQAGLPGTVGSGPATPGLVFDPDGDGAREFAAGGGGKGGSGIGEHPPYPGSGSGAVRSLGNAESGKDGIVIVRYKL